MAKKSPNLFDFKYAPCLFACLFVCLFVRLFVCLFVFFFDWFVCLDTESKSTCCSMDKQSPKFVWFKMCTKFVCLFIWLVCLFIWTLRAKARALQWPKSLQICQISNMHHVCLLVYLFICLAVCLFDWFVCLFGHWEQKHMLFNGQKVSKFVWF